MTRDNDERLTQSEINSIMSGRALPEDIFQRRETDRQKAVRQVEDFHMRRNPDLCEVLRQIECLKEENESICRRLAALEARQPPVLDGGRLPSDLSSLECQIFHTPLTSIPKDQRRVKTEWSLRLTAWGAGRRARATPKNYRFRSALSARWYNSTPDGMCRP